jgi:hypothetical protein
VTAPEELTAQRLTHLWTLQVAVEQTTAWAQV